VGRIFFLVLDVDNRERKSWLVWWEGRFPDVIIELLSDSTRYIDKGEKKALYEQRFRTPEYYLYDPFSQEFIGYHLQGVRYHERQPDASQQIYSPVTGLYLGVREEWLRWLTPEGVIIPSPREWAEQAQQAEQEHLRAEQAVQQAAQATQFLEEYRRRFGSLPDHT
jgi:hypothetical protein